MNKVILILLVAGGVIWDTGSAHRPMPPRHPLRLQRMAPRAPLHPRPPRHHHHHHHSPLQMQPQQSQLPQQQTHASQQHPNVIPSQQHSPKPHRSFKPRIHIPLLHGLSHRPLLARLHNLHHHHHHHPHHHHHHGPHKHAHPHHHHHHHGRPGQQAVAAAQMPRLPANIYNNNRPHQHQQQQNVGFPAIDATPAYATPSGAAPVGPGGHNNNGRQPIRHFPAQHPPHFNFHQDQEHHPFGNEPVSELPSNSPFPTQPSLQQTTSAYGETSPNPSGFLGSTYKGWKPIAKPFQSSYPRAQEQHPNNNQQPSGVAGLPDFPRGPHDFPRSPGFPRGPQDFPPLSDNHLGSFPIHDFPSGPTGPPGSQGNGLDGFTNIHDSPQIPGFTGMPSTTGNPAGDNRHPFDFPQYNQHFGGPAPPPPGRHRARHPPHAPKRPLYHSHPPPHNHQGFQFAPQGGHPSTTPRGEFPQFLPVNIPHENQFDSVNTNTLFRENTMKIRPLAHPHHLQQNNVLNGQDVVVPLPPEIGDTVRLPNSIFNEQNWAQQSNRDHNFETSQSEENVVIKKPKFGGGLKQKLNQGGLQGQLNGGGGASDETVENNHPSVLPKFRARRPNKQNEEDKTHDQQDNEKQSNGSDEGFGGQKKNNGRGRVRIRTRLRRPNPFSESAEENNSGGVGGPPPTSPRPFPPFPGSKGDSRLRNPFRKHPVNSSPPPDNNISTEAPNNSLGDDQGQLSQGPHKAPGIKGPISEELSNFPTLPFPPPDPEYIHDFPSPVPIHTMPSSPSPPSPSPAPKLREHNRLPPPFGRPPISVRHPQPPQDSTEQNHVLPSPSPPTHPPIRELHHGPRTHLRRRRPKPQKNHEDNQNNNPSEQPEHMPVLHHNFDGKNVQQQANNGGNELHNPQGLGLSQSLFSDEFFFPPGFNPDPSKHTQGENPVSFITMPNAKPHVIHHNIVQPQLHQQQLHSSNEQHNPNHHGIPQQNIFRGPTTQHFPPLEDFGQQQGHGANLGINNHQQQLHHAPVNHHHQPHHHQQHQQPQPHHQNVQLSAFSDHLSFSPPHPPPRQRKPPRNKHAGQPKPQQIPLSAPQILPQPQPILNPYAFPTGGNPYAGVTGQYVPPTVAQDVLDNAGQNSNSYEMPEVPGLLGSNPNNGNRQPGPVYHPQKQHLSNHPTRLHPQMPPPSGLPPNQLPMQPQLPPMRQQHQQHQQQQQQQQHPPPARGRFPGRPHPRKPIVPTMVDPVVLGQSAEFEQIPATYVDVSGLASTQPAGVHPTVPVTQARPVFSKPHVHHSPDIHPPGSFFDDFFKPFDDAFGQKPTGAVAVTQRSDGDIMMTPHDDDNDEHQSNSNVQLNVVPSPKTGNVTQQQDSKKKHWSKLKISAKEEKLAAAAAEASSLEKPGRLNKKPLNGRFANPKNHLKAKIADIARKNFQSHIMQAAVVDENGEEVAPEKVTTFRPSMIDSTTAITNTSEITTSASREGTTTLKVIPWRDMSNHDNDDVTDTNVPKSVRYGSKTDGPVLIHHRNKNNDHGKNEDPHQDGTTILFKSKRQFRRKRPGLEKEEPQRHEEVTGRPAPLRQKKEEAIPSSQSVEAEDNENGTTRVGVIRRRKLFPRRRNFSLSTKSSPKAMESSTRVADVTETESVTYGEGQWFRVKNAESHEEFGRVLDKLNAPSKTGDFQDPSLHNEEPSSRKSLHEAASSTSSVSTSMSTSSSSTSSKDEGRIKKSSKFLMNRLSIA